MVMSNRHHVGWAAIAMAEMMATEHPAALARVSVAVTVMPIKTLWLQGRRYSYSNCLPLILDNLFFLENYKSDVKRL